MNEIFDLLTRPKRLLLMMIIGGILGFITAAVLPKQYDASTHLSVSLDYNKVGALDDLEQDRLIGISEDIIHSDPVLTAACGETKDCSADSLQSRIRISRTLETWTLSVRDHDPKTAAEITRGWQQAAYDALMDAHEQSLKADALQKRLDALCGCLQEPNCPDPAALQEQVDTLAAEIRKANEAAHGLNSALRIGSPDPGDIQLRSASRSRAAGAILGVLFGMLAAFGSIWLPGTDGKDA